MTVTTLNNSAISSLAILGLNQTTREIADSTERLSSGSRFANASDDIGALASSNRLNSQLIGMRQGQTNNLQANSLLQTAFSAASEINDILDSMKALSVQANSGTLTTVERATLDLEFQELRAEIDSLANSTNFNDIQLLDGSASGQGDLQQKTNDATKASGSISFTGVFGAGSSLEINGTRFQGSAFGVGASATDSATNLFTYLSSSTDNNLMALEYELAGSSVLISSRAGGESGNSIYLWNVGNDANATITGQATPRAGGYTLSGGQDDGMFLGSTSVSGTMGDALLDSLSQTQADATLTIVDNSLLDDNDQLLLIDDGDGSTLAFTARTGAPATSQEFQIGATAEETLKNMVAAIQAYSGADDSGASQLEFEVDGSQLNIRSKLPGNPLDIIGSSLSLSKGASVPNTEALISSFSLNSGTNTGVNVNGVMNADFIGDSISGFSATYVAGDSITASITVGSDTYNATIADTTPAASTTVNFASTSGGFFTVDLAAGGASVADQNDADTFAARLDAAFSTLTFSQTRVVDNFVAAGQFAGGSAKLFSGDFTETPVIDSVTVRDSTTGGGNASIEFLIDGETYTNSNLSTSIGASEMFDLHSTTSDKYLRIVNGSGASADLSNATAAATYETSLRNAFGTDTEGSASLEFQIGSASSDKLSVTIGKATSDSLFDGESPDLLSQANAVLAQTAIDNALDEIGTIIADIGSSQSRLDYSYNANASIITEIDFARGQLADTDIVSESSAYAEAVVQQQAAISVLAQTQLLSNNLLGLLEMN
jgi:flagellin